MKIVQFVCGHVGQFKAIGDDGYCSECETWRDVDKEWPEQWWTECPRSCDWAKKSHGHAKIYGEQRVALHLRLTGHKMSLRYYSAAPSDIRAKITKRSQPRELPIDPPF